jgi:cytochrome c-type protein NapC
MGDDKGGSLWSKIRNRAYWSILIVGMVAGVIFWGGFNTAMEATNTMTFCISCHEMRDTVYQEYKESVHYKNPSGVQATCSDCHVPRPWVYKFVRKIKATNELYHKVMGTIDTPEKFEARRLHLAERVWESMRATDSRECRNCHDFNSMDLSEQDSYASKRHIRAQEKGETCIDCHDGIAHELPERPDDDEDD